MEDGGGEEEVCGVAKQGNRAATEESDAWVIGVGLRVVMAGMNDVMANVLDDPFKECKEKECVWSVCLRVIVIYLQRLSFCIPQ